MSISVVQHASNSATYVNGSTATLAATFGSNVTSGNTLVACISIVAAQTTWAPSVSSVNLNAGASWTAGPSKVNQGICTQIFTQPGSGGGATNVYVNVIFGGIAASADGVAVLVDIYEVSGVQTIAATDKTVSAGSGSSSLTSWTSGSTAATSAKNEIAFGVVGLIVPVASTTETVGVPGSPWVNEPTLHQTVTKGSPVLSTYNVYQQSGYDILSSSGAVVSYAGNTSQSSYYSAAELTLFGTFSSSDSFANQGESTFINAHLSSSDSYANQGEIGTVHATLSSSDSFSNHGETTFITEFLPQSDSFANQGETNLVLQIITDTDSFANQGETNLVLIGIQDFTESAKFKEVNHLIEFPSPPPGFLTTFFPTILRPVTSPIYYGRARISAVQPSMWKYLFRNTAVKTSNFKVISARKNAQAAVNWNALRRVEVVRVGAFNGLARPVVTPMDWPYRIDQIAWVNAVRTSASASTSWNTAQRKTGLSVKKTAWSTLGGGNSIQQTVQFNTLARVYVPESATFGYAGIDRPVVYPIVPTYLGSGIQIAWRLNSRLSPSQRVAWMTRIPVKTQKKIAFNTQSFHVTTGKQSTWMLKKRVTATQQSNWRDVTRGLSRKPVTWMTEFRQSPQKTSRFNVRKKVTASTVMQWKMVAHVVVRSRSTFNDRLAVKPQARTTWMTRYRYYATPIPPPQVVYAGKLVDRVVHPLGSMQGFAPNKAIQWRVPIFHVVSQSPTGNSGTTTIQWRVQRRLSASKKTTWTTVGRTNVKQPVVYNVVVPVSVQAVLKWNVGNVLVQRIHTSAQSREDFAY